jgi:hypothetical protein
MTQPRSSVDSSNSTTVSDEARQPLAPWEQRDKRVARGSLGLLLAILAGCSTLGEVMWPGSAPQSESLNFWVPLVVVLGCLFLLAGLLADRFVVLSKIILIGGGVILLASGVYFGLLSGGGARSIWAVLADFGPGVCAIAAGVLIGRARTSTPADSA